MASLIVLINLILACSSVLSQYRVDENSMCSPCEYETLMKVIGLELSCKRADDKSLREEMDSMKLHLYMLNERLENQEKTMKQKLEGKSCINHFETYHIWYLKRQCWWIQ